MSDNQRVFEIIRDAGYEIQEIEENETLWLNVKNDGNGFFTMRTSGSFRGGLSETSRAIEKAYQVTRGHPDLREKQITTLQSQLAAAQNEIASAEKEISILRLYGNKDCTAMADEALASYKESK